MDCRLLNARIGTLSGRQNRRVLIGWRAIFTSVRGSLVFCVGGNAFVYDGTALTEITDVDLPTVSRGGAGISSVTSMDGRIIFTEEGTDRLWWSGIFNPSDIDVLAFATAETFEDRLVRAIADHRELWLFGHKTIEIWRPVANSEQPFQRIGDMVIEKGCLSRLTIAKCDNTLFWVGQDAIVYRAEGITPKRISNHGIDRILSKLTEAELTQLHAFSYTDEGHAFYILTVPGVKTFCYDASTGEWHTRKSEGREDWGVTDYCEAFSSHFVLADMGVNRLSRDATSNAGSQIKRTATFNIPTYIPQPVERVAAYASSLDAAQAELDLDMSFEFTDDVGRTWSTPETVPIYQNGQHAQRVTVFRQGQIETPGRTYRLSVISDAARVTLGPAYVNEAEH